MNEQEIKNFLEETGELNADKVINHLRSHTDLFLPEEERNIGNDHPATLDDVIEAIKDFGMFDSDGPFLQ